MNFLERLLHSSPWWADTDWEQRDMSIKSARSAGFDFRHLDPSDRASENMPPGSISIIRGPRQVGKTTELKLLVADLISQDILPRSIAYYPCDDIVHFRELISLVETFVGTLKGTGYLLLDEITSVKNWPRAIKSLADAGRLENVYLLLTGSSAVEIKRGYERMPGRRKKGFDRAFLPMSFTDFCRAFHCEMHKTSLFHILSDESAFRAYEIEAYHVKKELSACLHMYLKWGGFPMVVRDMVNRSSVTEETLSVYRSVIFSEFEKQRRQIPVLLSLLRKMYSVLSTPISYSALSQDTGCSSAAVVQAYTEILSGAFLGFVLPCLNLERRLPYPKRQKKFYAVDPVIWQIVAQGTGFPPLDSATRAEEAVAVNLVRPFANTWAALGFMDSLYYWRSRKGREVDFVFYLAQGTEPFGVEVKYQGRLSGWDEQSIQKGIGQGLLVTRDSFKWGKVCHIPLWAFLLLSMEE